MDSLYASSGNLYMRRRGYKKTKLVRQGVLFRKLRADIEFRGVGVSCRVMLLRKLVRAA